MQYRPALWESIRFSCSTFFCIFLLCFCLKFGHALFCASSAHNIVTDIFSPWTAIKPHFFLRLQKIRFFKKSEKSQKSESIFSLRFTLLFQTSSPSSLSFFLFINRKVFQIRARRCFCSRYNTDRLISFFTPIIKKNRLFFSHSLSPPFLHSLTH